MITAFHLADNTASGLKAALNLFRHNRIRVEHLYCDSVALKSITYERFRGRVNWTSVDRFVQGRRSQLLCTKDTPLPKERGYRRFESDELGLRLCENAALYLLANIDAPDIRVALVDDSGDHVPMCGYLVDATNKVSVITSKPRLYLGEADRLLEEKGAVLHISKGDSFLKNADLIIAPARIERDLHCAEDAVILSSAVPLIAQNAPVISDYSFHMPPKYRELKPDYLEDMYFASAMYTLAGAHELGSEVFHRCSDGMTIHTRQSLVDQLKKRLDAR